VDELGPRRLGVVWGLWGAWRRGGRAEWVGGRVHPYVYLTTSWVGVQGGGVDFVGG